MNHKKGFTLIELLVVISIIGLLASVVLSSVDAARAKARDTRRIQDLKQIRAAILLYFDDNNESYPCVGLAGNDTVIENQSHCLATALAPYLSQIPTDPIYGGDGSFAAGNDYQYYTNAPGTVYALRVRLETEPFERNTSYPNGTTCNSAPTYPTCPWYGRDCIYYTGGSCEVQWFHLGNSF